MNPPVLRHVADLAIRVAAPVEIGETGVGQRRVIDILGGSVSGPLLSGQVRPGGADFQIIRPNGATELHARYVIELDDRATVYVDNTGLRFGPPAALERPRQRATVDPPLTTLRTTPRA